MFDRGVERVDEGKMERGRIVLSVVLGLWVLNVVEVFIE